MATLYYLSKKTDDHSALRLYGGDNEIYILEPDKLSGVTSYNYQTKEFQKIIQEPVDSLEVIDNFILYNSEASAYLYNIQTKETQHLVSFSKEKPESVKMVNGQPVSKENWKEQCRNCYIDGNNIYFLDYAQRSIDYDNSEDAINTIGYEYWTTIYHYNTSSNTLDVLKSSHSINSTLGDFSFKTDNPNFTIEETKENVISEIGYHDNQIYYLQGHASLHKFDVKTLNDKIIYASEEGNYLSWKHCSQNKLYIQEFEYSSGEIAKTDLVTIPLDNDIDYARIEISLNWMHSVSEAVYNYENSLFYMIYEGKIISFPWDSPDSYNIVYTIPGANSSTVYKLVLSNNHVFYYSWELISGGNWKAFQVSSNTETEIINSSLLKKYK